MKRIIIIFSVIIIFEACAYHDVIEYKDSDEKKENIIQLSENTRVEFEYIFCNKSYYEEKNPRYYLSSSCSIRSENEIELLNIDIKIKNNEGNILKLNNLSVGNGDQNNAYDSFRDFMKKKQIRFGWDIYMNYDYDYVKYKDIILEYSIEIKENGKLYKLKGEKKLHRNMRRVRTYPWFGA